MICNFKSCRWWKDDSNDTCDKYIDISYCPRRNKPHGCKYQYDYSKGSYVICTIDKKGTKRYALYDENDKFICVTSKDKVIEYKYKVIMDE